jgi:hypothetical protein
MSGQFAGVDLPGIEVLPKPIVPARLCTVIADAPVSRRCAAGSGRAAVI